MRFHTSKFYGNAGLIATPAKAGMAENLNRSAFPQTGQTGNATGCLWERFHRDACGDLSTDRLYQFIYILLMLTNEKPLEWIGSSHKDLMALPADVRRLLGFALSLAQ